MHGLVQCYVTIARNVGILIDADPGNRVSYHSKSGLILMNEDWLASSSAARILHILNVYCAYFGNGLGTFHPPERLLKSTSTAPDYFYLILINNSYPVINLIFCSFVFVSYESPTVMNDPTYSSKQYQSMNLDEVDALINDPKSINELINEFVA